MKSLKERKNRVYKANSLQKERYHQLVSESVARRYSPSEENAILRKAVAYLFDLVKALHPNDIVNDEFREYHEAVESLKRLHKEELDI